MIVFNKLPRFVKEYANYCIKEINSLYEDEPYVPTDGYIEIINDTLSTAEEGIINVFQAINYFTITVFNYQNELKLERTNDKYI